MPPNVVKTPHEEELWDKAKERAKEEGRAEDWPYVMGIFNRMTGKTASQKTAFTVPYAFSPVRVGGQRLSFQGIDILLAKDPAAKSAAQGCHRGMLRGSAAAGKDPVAAYVGPNALSPLAVLVREAGGKRALLVGFDSAAEAASAYQAHRRGSYQYRTASVGEVAEWAATLRTQRR